MRALRREDNVEFFHRTYVAKAQKNTNGLEHAFPFRLTWGVGFNPAIGTNTHRRLNQNTHVFNPEYISSGETAEEDTRPE